MTEIKYSAAELMIVNAARLLKDGDVVFVGVGQPNLACNLAKRTHAPNLVMIYEAGVIGAEPARLPRHDEGREVVGDHQRRPVGELEQRGGVAG